LSRPKRSIRAGAARRKSLTVTARRRGRLAGAAGCGTRSSQSRTRVNEAPCREARSAGHTSRRPAHCRRSNPRVLRQYADRLRITTQTCPSQTERTGLAFRCCSHRDRGSATVSRGQWLRLVQCESNESTFGVPAASRLHGSSLPRQNRVRVRIIDVGVGARHSTSDARRVECLNSIRIE